MNKLNVRSSTNLSGCSVQNASGTSQQARCGQNSRILLYRGSRGTCSQLTHGKHISLATATPSATLGIGVQILVKTDDA